MALEAEPIFAVLHEPPRDAHAARAGVIICPPFGWDELGAHRSLRALGGALAQAGHPALRFDFPAPATAAALRVTRIASTRGRLRSRPPPRRCAPSAGCERVVAVGVGLGGIVAFRATALGAADRRPRPVGRSIQRQPARARAARVRAHGRLRAGRHRARARGAAAPDEDPLEEGDLNVAGFVLTAETLADLEALDLTALELPDGARRRVLLLGRDTLAPDRRLRAHLEQSGVELTVAAGPGFEAMMVDPHLAQIPRETIARTSSGSARRGDSAGGRRQLRARRRRARRTRSSS